MVVAKAFAATACMVARAEGSALAQAWARAVESPATPPTSRIKARNVNAGGSRMREIRTYGLNEGLLARALRTAGWGLLHHGRVVGRRWVVEMAPPVIVIRRCTDERGTQTASPARVCAFTLML